MAKTYRVTLENFIDVELSDADFSSIGTTADHASISEIRNLINTKLFHILDYDSFNFKERSEM